MKGEALKIMRESRGWTQVQLAKKTDMSVRVLQNLEQGARDINKASVETVLRLSEALGCDIYDIINERTRTYVDYGDEVTDTEDDKIKIY